MHRRMKKIIATLYVATLVVMGAATFVENGHGRAFAHQHIYGAWWFVALWAVLAVAGAIYLVVRRERRPAVLLLHGAFLTILAGALLSHLTGRSGTVHLRTGIPQYIAVMEHNGQQYLERLDGPVVLQHFRIVADTTGRPRDFVSVFLVDGDTAEVSMNRIYRHGALRFYQASYDLDEQGSTLIINRDPYGIPVTYAGYSLLLVAFLWICRRKRPSWRIALPCLALTLGWCLYYFVLDGRWTQIPVLRSPLLFVHVVIVIMAYALLLLQAVRSAVWLGRRRTDIATTADEGHTLKVALGLLSIGIFLGAVWANISWGNYWSWDSKEVWALITLMVYAVPVHRASLPAFRRPLVWNTYMLAAFLVVLMTYFGVNYFLAGLHSYA
ncbi:MAG: cytochrome c biogenesis protein CcsA [Bacteroidaceae bacterium]|nr:cytochrome c biogenesis protein CcsA [Bacteroidaceae bacterium]